MTLGSVTMGDTATSSAQGDSPAPTLSRAVDVRLRRVVRAGRQAVDLEQQRQQSRLLVEGAEDGAGGDAVARHPQDVDRVTRRDVAAVEHGEVDAGSAVGDEPLGPV